MVLAQWTAHPAKRRPREVALVAAVALLFSGAVLASLQSPFLAVLSVVVLLIAIGPFLLPTRYTLTDDDVIEHRAWRTRSRRWADLRRVQVGSGAALLSPFARPNWLDRYRGILLMFDGGDRERILKIVEDKVGRAGE